MSKDEALLKARTLVAEAMEIADLANIDPALVVSPHCDDRPLASNAEQIMARDQWLGVAVVADEETQGLFEMPQPNADPDQSPTFRVTPSTAELVGQDFGRYEESLGRMLKDWREEKSRFMSDRKDDER